MAFFQIEAGNQLKSVNPSTFQLLGMKERQDIQALLRDNPAAIDPELLVVAEEFSNWQDSGRRVDLLGLDKNANLVVIELKRVEEGGHMELQALRYAAMLSTVDFQQVVEAYAARLNQPLAEAEQLLLDFLDVATADEAGISNTPRIVLMAPSFSREMTTTILWLNERKFDIRCLSITPYEIDNRRFLEIEQLIPLPSATDYIVQKRAKETQAEKQAVTKKRRGRSLQTLLEAGAVQAGDTLELVRLPHSLIGQVPEEHRLADLQPDGQVRWLTDGNTYSISNLCAVICARFAPGIISTDYPFAGPDYWARKGQKTSLSELARTLPVGGITNE